MSPRYCNITKQTVNQEPTISIDKYVVLTWFSEEVGGYVCRLCFQYV